VVTGSGGARRHGEGGAPPGAVRCHRLFSTKTREGEGVTAMVMAMHHPNFPEAEDFGWLAWVVTATLRAVSLPLCPVPLR
jgi:hypothetical protein